MNPNHYWKIEDGRIVALMGMSFGVNDIPVGSIGAIIPAHVKLPDPGYDVWIAADVKFDTPSCERSQIAIESGTYIGPRCHVGIEVEIGEGCFIDREVTIRNRVRIGNGSSIGENSNIRGFATISNAVDIGRDVSIGEFAVIGDGSSVGHDTKIDNGCVIGRMVHIGDDCRINVCANILDKCNLRNGVSLGNYVYVGDRTTIGNYTHIGNDVKLDRELIVTAHSTLINGKIVQLHNIGGNGRNMIIYVDRYGDVVMSIGCQNGISLKSFKSRIKRKMTSNDSIEIYRNQMEIIEAAFKSVGRANGVSTIYKVFQFAKKMFGIVELGR
ncbi:hypothetical protein AHP1_881 [Aeromonas phage Ahp1_CNU-2021]|nr:hypothetical protein AHP1_881 [Aeromonas phage Ahp1_CNU-2021]